ncbi:hypothetical protein LP414_05725 [Polaromonas sp. P1(28)-13]|nr:hypothetical protein LP414_05725 [Polaromonas sp. P1(28)-13]
MDLAKNNFPKSAALWCRAVVPARQVLIEADAHGFEEVCGALFPAAYTPSRISTDTFNPVVVFVFAMNCLAISTV